MSACPLSEARTQRPAAHQLSGWGPPLALAREEGQEVALSSCRAGRRQSRDSNLDRDLPSWVLPPSGDQEGSQRSRQIWASFCHSLGLSRVHLARGSLRAFWV